MCILKNMLCIWHSTRSPSSEIWGSLNTNDFVYILLGATFIWSRNVHLLCRLINISVFAPDNSYCEVMLQLVSSFLRSGLWAPIFEATIIWQHWYFARVSLFLFVDNQPQWLIWAYTLAPYYLFYWLYALSGCSGVYVEVNKRCITGVSHCFDCTCKDCWCEHLTKYETSCVSKHCAILPHCCAFADVTRC